MRDFWVIIVVRAVKPMKRLHSRNRSENELMNTYARHPKTSVLIDFMIIEGVVFILNEGED